MVCKAARNNGSMSAELCKWPLTKHAPGASNACRDGALNDAIRGGLQQSDVCNSFGLHIG